MYEKTVPKLNKKRCLKTDAKKSNNTSKMTPKSIPKDDFISGVAPLGAPLVALTSFGHQKLAPRAPKVFPMIEKSTKNDTSSWPTSLLPMKNLRGQQDNGLVSMFETTDWYPLEVEWWHRSNRSVWPFPTSFKP